MAVTLCVPPYHDELCASVRFELEEESTSSSSPPATASPRWRPTRANGTVGIWIDITDPATARPVHVRFDLVKPGGDHGLRGIALGEVERNGTSVEVVGTYLGVVSEEIDRGLQRPPRTANREPSDKKRHPVFADYAAELNADRPLAQRSALGASGTPEDWWKTRGSIAIRRGAGGMGSQSSHGELESRRRVTADIARV